MATALDAQHFEQFLNRLHPYGLRASIVDEDGALPAEVGAWVKDIWRATVLSARESSDSEVLFYAVELAVDGDPEPGESLIVYITDPAEQPRLDVYLFRLHTSAGVPEERFLMLAAAPSQGVT